MVDPISSKPVTPIGPLTRPGELSSGSAEAGPSFAAALRQQLERVSAIQSEAQQGVQELLTGRTQNITDVFVATRKAEMAFTLLMEIRNKLTEAYSEIKSLRV